MALPILPALRGGSFSAVGGGGGSSIFGSNVPNIPMPQPFQDLSGVYPNLSGTNAAVSASILSKLGGNLSPATINAIQDNAARFGVQSGMPGSGLSRNLSLRDLGLTSEQVQQQGIQDYGSIIPAISGTQTVNPATQIALNETNAVNSAAPNPTAANTYAQSLFQKYMNMLNPGKPSTWNNAPTTEHFFRI